MGWLTDTFGDFASGITGGFGSLVDTGLETYSANYLAKKADQRNRATQEYLARNSPQWQVEGLRQAGLNPILAVANGVSTPQALSTAGSGKVNSNILQNISTAKTLSLQDEQLRTQRAQTLKTNAEAYESYERTWNIEVQRKIALAQLPAVQAQALLDRSKAEFLSKYPELWKASMIGNTANDVLQPIIDSAGMFVDAWLKNKGIDTFGNNQPPNQSKKRVRFK